MPAFPNKNTSPFEPRELAAKVKREGGGATQLREANDGGVMR